MGAGRFISGRIRFKGGLAVTATAVSFLVIIMSLAISGGFRKEIRKALSETYGEIVVKTPTALPAIESVEGVVSVRPEMLRNGIIKSDLHVIGAVFRGTVRNDSLSLMAEIPSSLASKTGLAVGDRLQTFFVGDRLQARNFTVAAIYEDLASRSDAAVIKVDIRDLQRLEGLEEGSFTSLNVALDEKIHGRNELVRKAMEISFRSGVLAESLPDRFPQLFDWLELIDANVLTILLLMAVVAGFNMISGLLILLFRNISTIGTLKALGMTDLGIAGIFLRAGSKVILKGMAVGNALALALCLIQDKTHLVRLDPDNYFLSFVPIGIDIPVFLAANLFAYAVIMVLLLLPVLFISKVDPARTVRED